MSKLSDSRKEDFADGSLGGWADPNLKDPPAQQILNEQGYLVIRSSRAHPIGHVLDHLSGGKGYAVLPGPMAIIGESTREEWKAQAMRFAGESNPKASPWDLFYKVVAE